MNKPVKILAVGGGSGGHVTPVVAVLKELRADNPQAELRFWCDKAFGKQARNIMSNYDASIPVDIITAGKLRRYHHLKWWQHFTIPSVFWPNLFDVLLVAIGVVQSVIKLLIWRPDVVFTKGGYVCLPVGWAASLLKIPLVIHDSDAHPGLTNRLLAGRATLIGTGAPLEYYSYPAKISRYVGIPISDEFKPYDAKRRQEIKNGLGFSGDRPLTVITGGGLGARRINDAVALHLDALLEFTNILLVSGAAQYDELLAITPQDDPRFLLEAFVSTGMADRLGAADVVVARAGATTLLELAALAQPTLLIPNGRLTGGHQLKNAKVYADAGAVVLLGEDGLAEPDDTSLVDTLYGLIKDEAERKRLATAIHRLARPRAAKDMAEMIMQAAKNVDNF